MLSRGLKGSLAALVLGLVLVNGAIANQPERLTSLPSGKQIPIIVLGPAIGDGGKTKAIMLRYRTQRQMNDRDGLSREADDIWDLFKIDADRSGLTTAVISAESAAPDPHTGKNATASFVLEKESNGEWFCRNDRLVGVGTPAKIAYRQAFALVSQGRYQEALDKYNKSVALDPTYAQNYVDRAGVYIVMKQWDRALPDIDIALSLLPDNAGAYCNRGIVYSKLGKSKAAIADFTSAIKLNPDFGLSYAERGFEYCKLGQYESAVDDLNKAINAHAKLGQSFYYRAICLEKVAQADKERAAKLGFSPSDGKPIAVAQHRSGKQGTK